MPVTVTSIEIASSTTDTTSYTTSSLTLTANKLLLISVASVRAGMEPSSPTLSLTGWTFAQIGSGVFYGGGYKTSLYRAIGSGNGTMTIDFGAETQLGCLWSIAQFDNTKITGTAASDAIVQSNTNLANSGATSFSVSLSAFASASNATFSTVSKNALNNVIPGTNFNEIGETTITTPDMAIQTQWYDAPDTTADGTFSGSGGDGYGAIAVEIAFQPAGGDFFLLMN